MPRRLMSFKKDRRGVTAVEFAIVGPIFLMMVLFIIQIGLFLMIQSTLDLATDAGARQVEIGQIRTGQGNPQSQFQAVVCQNSIMLGACGTSFQTYAMSSTSGMGAIFPATLDSSGTLSSTAFDIGTSASYVVVQVVYTTPNLIPFMDRILGSSLFAAESIVAFQNEPY